jgi:hypothetical protein
LGNHWLLGHLDDGANKAPCKGAAKAEALKVEGILD